MQAAHCVKSTTCTVDVHSRRRLRPLLAKRRIQPSYCPLRLQEQRDRHVYREESDFTCLFLQTIQGPVRLTMQSLKKHPAIFSMEILPIHTNSRSMTSRTGEQVRCCGLAEWQSALNSPFNAPRFWAVLAGQGVAKKKLLKWHAWKTSIRNHKAADLPRWISRFKGASGKSW